MASVPQELPPPVVPADAYTDDYFRRVCGHADVWEASAGRDVGGIYPGMLARTGFTAGETLIDIGAGRGELVALAIEQGAARAVGVEYSSAAVDLATRTFEAHGITGRAEMILADARAVPIEDAAADLVTLLDVVEHLSPAELERTLAEAFRLLRPGGRIHIHTFPTSTLYNVTYRCQRLVRPSRWKAWPADPRLDVERLMHVNEQSLWRLRRSLKKAGFGAVDVAPGEWIYTDFVPDEGAKLLYHRLAEHSLTRPFGSSNLFASGTRPHTSNAGLPDRRRAFRNAKARFAQRLRA